MFTIFAVPIQLWKFYNSKYLLYIGIYQEEMPNGKLIATQIGSDTDNSEKCT